MDFKANNAQGEKKIVQTHTGNSAGKLINQSSQHHYTAVD